MACQTNTRKRRRKIGNERKSEQRGKKKEKRGHQQGPRHPHQREQRGRQKTTPLASSSTTPMPTTLFTAPNGLHDPYWHAVYQVVLVRRQQGTQGQKRVPHLPVLSWRSLAYLMPPCRQAMPADHPETILVFFCSEYRRSYGVPPSTKYSTLQHSTVQSVGPGTVR